MTYNLSKPMRYENFRQMPADLQQQYLERLQEEFHAPVTWIARMMGVNYPAFRDYIIRHGLRTVRFRKPSEAKEAAWWNFLGKRDLKLDGISEAETTEVPAESDGEPGEHPAEEDNGFRMTSFSLEGVYNPRDLLEALYQRIQPGERIRVSVERL